MRGIWNHILFPINRTILIKHCFIAMILEIRNFATFDFVICHVIQDDFRDIFGNCCCYYYLKFRSCPHGFLCLGSIGENPNYGFTSFDNLLWSMLTTFQLITLDYWENVYNMVSNNTANNIYANLN